MSRVELVVNGEIRESQAIPPDQASGSWSFKVEESCWLALLVRGHYADQGPTRGLGKIRFHDFNIAYNSLNLPNLDIFKDQIKVLQKLMIAGPPDKQQQRDIDFLLILGELFTLVAYGQLIIENAKIVSFPVAGARIAL